MPNLLTRIPYALAQALHSAKAVSAFANRPQEPPAVASRHVRARLIYQITDDVDPSVGFAPSVQHPSASLALRRMARRFLQESSAYVGRAAQRIGEQAAGLSEAATVLTLRLAWRIQAIRSTRNIRLAGIVPVVVTILAAGGWMLQSKLKMPSLFTSRASEIVIARPQPASQLPVGSAPAIWHEPTPKPVEEVGPSPRAGGQREQPRTESSKILPPVQRANAAASSTRDFGSTQTPSTGQRPTAVVSAKPMPKSMAVVEPSRNMAVRLDQPKTNSADVLNPHVISDKPTTTLTEAEPRASVQLYQPKTSSPDFVSPIQRASAAASLARVVPLHLYSATDADVTPPSAINLEGVESPLPRAKTTVRLVEVVVNEEGIVESVQTTIRPRTMTESIQLAADLQALKAWRFRPALKEGVAVRYRQVISLGR